MAAARVELGSLELLSKESALKLQVSSSAQFASPANGDIDKFKTRLTASVLSPQVGSRPWVSAAANYRFVLTLRTDFGLELAEQSTLVEALAARLHKAEVSIPPFWQQLCLSPTSVQLSTDSANTHRLEISLSPFEPNPNQRRRALHRLGIDVPSHAVAPPPGIFEAKLETMEVRLFITKTAISKQRPRKRRRVGCDIDEVSGATLGAYTCCHGSSINDVPTCAGVLGHAFSEQSQACVESDANDLFADAGNHQPDDHSRTTIYQPDFDILMLKPRPASRPACLRTSSMRPAAVQSDVRRTTLGLIDTALRLVICGSSTRSPRALWSPGSLPAVASRSVFLPTIAHALSSVCGVHASTDNLRRKYQQATRLGDALLEPLRSNTIKTAGDALDVRLWQKLTTSAFNPALAKDLKLFTTVHKRFESSSRDDDDNLLDTIDHDAGLDGFFDTNETDLFDMNCWEDVCDCDVDLFESEAKYLTSQFFEDLADGQATRKWIRRHDEDLWRVGTALVEAPFELDARYDARFSTPKLYCESEETEHDLLSVCESVESCFLQDEQHDERCFDWYCDDMLPI